MLIYCPLPYRPDQADIGCSIDLTILTYSHDLAILAILKVKGASDLTLKVILKELAALLIHSFTHAPRAP